VSPEDAELVQACLAGKASAFGRLYERYKAMVYELAYRTTRNREDAEDVLQDTFLKAMRSLSTYNHQYKFSTWLLTIAHRLCIDRWRAGRGRDVSLNGEAGRGAVQLPSTGESPEEHLSKQELAALVEKGLREVPEEYRTFLILRHRLDLTYEEISRIMGMPLGTVKTRIHRARERLAHALSAARAECVDQEGGRIG
jgi:RNA polymerase sigma-70 factor (ECF subfamily)